MKQFLLLLALLPAAAQAQGIFAPGNTVFGVRQAGTDILISNNSPGAEGPLHAIDGVGQKYLNFDELDAGLMASPVGGPSIVGSVQVWTANDATERDPASYAVYGTNLTLNGAGMLLSDFTLISQGPLALPLTRNPGGAAALDPADSQTITFANSSAYLNYLILFPTVRNAATANSMQVAEVQLFTSSVPDPGPGLIFTGLLLTGLCAFRARLSRRGGS